MLHRPRATGVGVPPCARTMPAARLLAPSPTRPRSMTMTRSAPDVLAKYEAHPPTVPAPTMTRSARFSLIIPRLRRSLSDQETPTLPSPASGGGKGAMPRGREKKAPPALPRKRGRESEGRGGSWLGDVAGADDERGDRREDNGVEGEHRDRLTGRDQGRGRRTTSDRMAERLDQSVRVLAQEKLFDGRQPARIETAQQAEEDTLDRQDVRQSDADRHRRLPEEIGESNAEQTPRLEDEPGGAQRLKHVDDGRPGNR